MERLGDLGVIQFVDVRREVEETPAGCRRRQRWSEIPPGIAPLCNWDSYSPDDFLRNEFMGRF